MNTNIAIQKTEYQKIISLPLTLEQIAFSLKQLSRTDLEILEELMDKKFQKTILSRGKEIVSQYKKGQTDSLKQLQRDFGK
ncbi:MAG: hypothetical protein A3D74_05210 [Candidatus Levybacteria bacterium RIFCSPHIGHO2_02_FULL_37_13]|nr:MAG: hypothetical protein A3D74_05210 [Candidatus Levybacteria bacterium RIFCSPHIGHO2_02_FULL_37_13]OGH29059.1 MAG: hypothetical protein A3E40_02730 [Candidatus Levybacteria bacterium RIFCSPHIGHO2_12_FULL_37_9]OGH39720.1 MAG: hypothetical protein A3B41_00710 [Candidatus Levybacteria bacterium RIFCSPLOWO2_01_FULL_37_26]